MKIDDYIARVHEGLERERTAALEKRARLEALHRILGDVTVDERGEPRTSRVELAEGVCFDVFRGGCDGRFDEPAAIYATPFAVVGERRVLLDRDFWIGERVGDTTAARPGWEKELRDAGVPPVVVELCRRHLAGL